jgi:hypothetical protein
METKFAWMSSDKTIRIYAVRKYKPGICCMQVEECRVTFQAFLGILWRRDSGG